MQRTNQTDSADTAKHAAGIMARPATEPIAILGIGCRLPGGAADPADLWQLLKSGSDVISEVPESRWKLSQWYDPEPQAGKTYARWGGFIDDVAGFDAAFFGVSPREAAAIDPQQRLLLQTAYEALEDGGQTPELMRGKRTGVYVGMWGSDYEDFLFSDPGHIDFYRTQGTGRYTAAGRLSFVLGLDGPSLAVDTACSSSLVTVHLACQAIRNGDCELALAGGVNLLLQPQITIAYSQSRMMATDGRCRFGDATGSGYVRSEGVGLVVLKKLSAALADRDPIYAVIRGSAINNDGKSSGSFGTPGIRGQEAMLRSAYKSAGVDPREVRFVEAHGTGTKRGDPVEVRALANVLCEDRPKDRPLLIGSVKTNIGHMEAAAGIGGLLKATLALDKGAVPASLHFNAPNPNIPFHLLPIEIPTELSELPDDGQVHYAGVNSFGISGTNAHIVLAESPLESRGGSAKQSDTESEGHVLNLTARSVPALRGLAEKYIAFINETSEDAVALADICYTLSVRRNLHEHRLSVAGRTREELVEGLEAFLAEEERPGLQSAQIAFKYEAPPIRTAAFVYSGQGSQWIDMGRDLLEREEVFRVLMQECDRGIQALAGWSVIEEISRSESDGSRLNDIDVMWPAIFSIQVAVTEYLKSLGIRPAAVVGHSIGEAAAAWASGALSLEDAIRVIVTQGKLVHETNGKGAMALVGLSFEATEAELENQKLAGDGAQGLVAAIESSPEASVVSGEPAAVDQLVAELEERGVFARKVNTGAAVHSAQMDPLKDRLLSELADLKPQRANIPFYSATYGSPFETAASGLDADYFWENLRRPVLFASAIDAIFYDDVPVFLEISPHPIVTVSVQETIRGHQNKGFAISSLRKDEDSLNRLGATIQSLSAAGVPVDFDRARAESQIPPLKIHSGKPRLAFVFSGQGPQWWAMGRELLEKEPIFRAKVEEIDRLLEQEAGWSLLDELRADEEKSKMSETRIAQPAIFALQVGLAELWQSWGVQPDAITGHSVGEVAAAHVSGKLSLEDAVRVIYHRGRLMQDATGLGKMAAIEAPLDRAREFIAGYEDRLAIGAANSPNSTVLSGETAALEEVLKKVEAAGIYQKMLPVNYAFHSPQMEPFKQQMNEQMQGLQTKAPRVPIVSTVTGELADEAAYGAEYWGENIRQGVLFATAIDTLIENDFDVFIEIGPHPVLSAYMLQCLEQAEHAGHAIPSLRRNQPEHLTLLGNLGALFVSGYPIDWRRMYSVAANTNTSAKATDQEDAAVEWVETGRCVRLPAYAWQTERFWIDPPKLSGGREIQAAGAGDSHPMLQRKLETAQPIFEAHLAGEDLGLSWLDLPVLSPMVTLDGVLAAALRETESGAIHLTDLSFSRLARIGDESGANHQILLTGDDEKQSLARAYDASLTDGDAPAKWFRNFSCTIEYPGIGTELNPAVPESAAETTRELSGEELYSFLSDQGYSVPASLRAIESAAFGAGEATAELGVVSDPYRSAAAMDAILQLANVLCMQDRGSAGLIFVPESARRLALLHADTVGRIHLVAGDQAESIECQVYLQDQDGASVGFIDGLQLRTMSRAGLVQISGRELEDWLYEPEWIEAALTPADTRGANIAAGRILVFADQTGIAGQLAGSVEDSASICMVRPGPEYSYSDAECTLPVADRESCERLLSDASSAGEISQIVFLWGCFAGEVLEAIGNWQETQKLSAGTLLALAQAVAEHSAKPQLNVITRGAQPVQYGVGFPAPEQATLWGCAAVIEKEISEIKCLRIDLDPADDLAGTVIARELSVSGDDLCVGYRGGKRYVQRLVRTVLNSTATSDSSVSGNSRSSNQANQDAAGPARPVVLDSRERGVLDNLFLRPQKRTLPAPGEVEIEVEATGVNFRDVLSAMDMYPGGTVPFGVECAGRIAAIGENVEDFHVGDEVIAISPEPCFASYVRVPADLLVKKPAHLSFVESATIPAVFLTCYYSLFHLARITDRDRVLIHSAAGGVGLAAIQLAKLAGAEIYATCSTEEKKEYLKSLGVKHIFNSRTLDFVDEIRTATNGEGVDVVLNSLSGEFIPKNISLLRDGGRYLEIGKKDVLSAKEVHRIKKRVSYFLIDLMEIADSNSDLIQSMLLQLSEEFEARNLQPLPLREFADAADAFRYMANGKHIGKVVVRRPSESPVEEPGFSGLRADGAYLISGGLGDLGLLFARDLAEQGAGNIVLSGRRGASPEVQSQLDEISQSTGTRITVLKGDVSREEDVVRILNDIRKDVAPLRGIIHAAGILDDAALAQQSWERFETVMQSKVAGAFYLHKHTAQDPLDFYVMFSSIASLLGLRGQSNYSAANAFMDALAHHRQSRGLPGLSIHWGPWADVGMVADLEADLLRAGIDPLPPRTGLLAMRRLLASGVPEAGVIHMNWSRFLEQFPAQTPNFFTNLVRIDGGGEATAANVGRGFLDELRETQPVARRRMVFDHVRAQLAKILGMNPSALDTSRGFKEMGLDSLMTVELRNRLQANLETTLPSTMAFDYPNAEILADYLIDEALVFDDADQASESESESEVEVERQAEPQTKAEAAPAPERQAPLDAARPVAKPARPAASKVAAPVAGEGVEGMVAGLGEISDDDALAELMGN
ncbi:MAG: SDR family NAD(P)-dependent oxidoreductase [bacterium]|nr:SDR family NAD(P)-dependent oxidoreductase [bacterium]